MALKNLLRRKTRTLLTLLGIAIGVAAVVALGALGEGFKSGYGSMASGSNTDLLVLQRDAIDVSFSAIDQDLKPVLAGQRGVTAISEMIYTFAATDNVPYFIAYGYDPAGFAIQKFKIVAGESLAAQSNVPGGRPLLLGQAMADDLEKQVGDTFRLYGTLFRIVGIYETGAPFEDGAAVLTLEDAQVISGKPRQVNAFLLQVRPGTDIEALSQHIEKRFDKLTTTTSANFAEDQDMFKYIDAYIWGISLVAVLIGGVGVMNTIMMSVVERTREIGVLRAVGWRRREVLKMIVGESFVLSLLGGWLGVGLGLGVVRALEGTPTLSAMLPSAFSFSLYLRGMGVALGLGLVGGALPAFRASQLTPAAAMRSESSNVQIASGVRSAALRNILRQPTRTLLTVVGIAIALMAMILLGAMSAGMIDVIGGMTGGLDADLAGIEADASMDLSKIDVGEVHRLSRLPGVEEAEGFLTGYTVVGDLPFFVAFGYAPRGLAIRKFKVVEGEPLQTNHQILLGRVAADNLHKKTGDTLRLFDSSFRIVGIYETGVPMQDGGGVLTLRDAQNLFGQPHKVSFIGVWLSDPSLAEQVIATAEEKFPEISLSRAAEFTEDLSDMQMMEASTWGIAMLALIVGGLGMTNTMVMSIYERTREIGVLRALGWGRRRVLNMIVYESITLSLLGGVVGTLVGLLLGWLLNQNSIIQGFLTLKYEPALFAQAFITALLLGIVGGVYPAWRASNLQPAEALRYE